MLRVRRLQHRDDQHELWLPVWLHRHRLHLRALLPDRRQEQLRNVVHVGDLVEALLRTVDALCAHHLAARQPVFWVADHLRLATAREPAAAAYHKRLATAREPAAAAYLKRGLTGAKGCPPRIGQLAPL